MAQDEQPADVIAVAEFAQRLDVCERTIWAREQDGTIPPAVRINARSVVWLRAVVDQWFEDGMPKVVKKGRKHGKTKR